MRDTLNFQIHFTEFKYRVVYIFFSFCLTAMSSYFYIGYIIYFFSIPLLEIKTKATWLSQADFIFTNVFEAFYAHYFVAFTTGLYLSIPVLLKVMLGFIKVGLQSHEKNSIFFVLHWFFLCCLCAILFLYKILLPLILTFFLTYENTSKTNLYTLKLEQKLVDYISLVVFCLFWSTILFQVPLVLLFVLIKNIVNFSNLINNRRILCLTFLIIGTILSPPDIFSQILIALFLGVLFEIIFFLYYVKLLYYTIIRKFFVWYELVLTKPFLEIGSNPMLSLYKIYFYYDTIQ